MCGALAGCWVTAAVLLLSPLLVLSPLFGFGMGGLPHHTALLLSVFGSMAMFGAGLMFAVVLQFATKWFVKLTFKYIQFNWSIIKGA
nr:DUF1700 domain-containing protein [Paenibacillus sp. VKM B-2647]